MASLLTSDDLDGLGADVQTARDPRRHARDLVDAVEGGRLADPDDAGYALSLAAEAHELAGDHDEALALSARAVAASADTVDGPWLHAMHAERLLRRGDEGAGMAALTSLRPLLHRDASAVLPIVEALSETGRAEIAEQWLTAALLTATEREERLAEGSDEQLDAADVVDELLARRRHVRADLGRAPDEYDALADDLDAAPDLVFFPEAALARLLAAQPALADELGRDWDHHRALVEGELQAADAEGEVLEVEVATPSLLAAMLADPDSPDQADPEPGPRLAWPPGRNDPCWCGAGAKYKKCCLPRGRDRDEP
ncbi:MAG TPA: SEC-C domain-containing protein, partial [Actinomycetospora sp.]|nr:SEC-C domain-containing protein [Actinomycetospora sp.]